ncbi:YeeE/YedE family protein [Zobellella maritima]|uniref:YeeE/YedE family protein n=1 Tax=Zobellella maritima TaxID=2059725 RepID=UPI000E304C6E|nr:YeeE/YedE thiosulfate transporter family protein [Zobellella maritima]
MLIGLGALLLMVVAGRVAGISGIISGIGSQPDKGWRLAFVVGLLLIPLLLFQAKMVEVPSLAAVAPGKLLLAGLLVGVGTRLGNGCTSGHGICGMGRGSLRSVVATLVFIVAGMVTVTLLK